MKMELQRWTVALFAESAQPFTYAGVAESPEGKADILETKDEAGRAVRLFVDQSTHLPLMVQHGDSPARDDDGRPGRSWWTARPGCRSRRRPASLRRGDEAAHGRDAQAGPPQPSQFAMHLGDYKKVDGVMLPHKIGISIEGQPNEEWTIEKFRVNPSVKDSEFEKPKQ